MTTETNQQDEARKIWEQLDAEDSGQQAVETANDTGLQDESTAAGKAAGSDETKQDQTTSNPAPEQDAKALLNKIVGLESMVAQLTGRLRNAEGHIGGLTSQLKQRLEVARTVAASGGEAPSAREIQAAQASPAAFAELEKEYPEFAKALKPLQDAIDSRLSAIERGRQAAAPSDAQPAQDETQVTQDDLVAMNRDLTVEIAHKGWKQTVKTPEFHGWLAQAPLEVRMLAAGDEPEQAIRLLDLYAEFVNKPNPTTQRDTRRLETAAVLPTGTRSSVKTKNVDEMTGEEYWRYLDQIDKQKA